MRLGSAVAVAQASSCSCDVALSLGTSICHRCDPKMEKKSHLYYSCGVSSQRDGYSAKQPEISQGAGWIPCGFQLTLDYQCLALLLPLNLSHFFFFHFHGQLEGIQAPSGVNPNGHQVPSQSLGFPNALDTHFQTLLEGDQRARRPTVWGQGLACLSRTFWPGGYVQTRKCALACTNCEAVTLPTHWHPSGTSLYASSSSHAHTHTYTHTHTHTHPYTPEDTGIHTCTHRPFSFGASVIPKDPHTLGDWSCPLAHGVAGRVIYLIGSRADPSGVSSLGQW